MRKVGGQVPGTLFHTGGWPQWGDGPSSWVKVTARSRDQGSGRRGAKVRGRGKSRGCGGRKRWGRKGKKPGACTKRVRLSRNSEARGARSEKG